jgi:myosin heavy subunit
MARGETFKVPLSASSAKEACDAFAKDIYLKTFLWLVRTINDTTCAEMNYKHDPTHGDFGVIGLLDIFGFESFETNGFGQLCINYANEKLQQKAINDIFRETKAEYDSEGIPLYQIEIDDNEQVLKVIEGRSGLIALLNEECYRPKGNDKAFVSKVLDNYKESRFVLTPKRGCDNQFGVAHYAGRVMYTAENFVENNQDTLPIDLKECAKKCSNVIVADLLNSDSSTKRASAKSTDEPVTYVSNTSVSIKEECVACATRLPSTLATHHSNASPLDLQKVFTGSRSMKRSVVNRAQAVPGQSIYGHIRFKTHTMKDESTFSTATRLQLQDPAGQSQPIRNKSDYFTGEFNTKQNKSDILTSKSLSEPMPQAHNGSVNRTLKRSTSSDFMAATVWTKYQEQLSSLMMKLGGTHSRYVRCIKPNRTKTPKAMDRLTATEQLRCAGIVATVKLSRAIYPNSLPNKLLRCRYLSMWDQKKYPSKAKRVDKPEMRHKLECEAILSCALKPLELETDGKRVLPYAVGKTRTYFRKGAVEWLESNRVLELDRIATVIEKRARGMLARIHMTRYQMGASLIQKCYRNILECRRQKLDMNAAVIQKQARGVLARLFLSKLRQVVPLIQSWYRRVSKHRKLTRVMLNNTAKDIPRVSKPRGQKRDVMALRIQTKARGSQARLHLSKYQRAVHLIQRWYRSTSKQRTLDAVLRKRRYLKARNVFEPKEIVS